MKLYILIISIAILSSCEKNVIGNFEAASPSTVVNPVNKKGACYTVLGKNWSYKTHDLGVHWMYNWGLRTNTKIPDNVEFIPMFWGKGSVTDANIAYLKQQKAEGKAKYVLGFNEPDGAAQANMTVDEAIALWPKLEEIGLPLGSPAAVNPKGAWMVEFMQKAAAKNLRIDFICVHSYGGSSASSLITSLRDVYDLYKRPIWITEFAVADWTATTTANNKFTEASVISYMKDVLPQLDEIEWIHRYAWFDGGSSVPLYNSTLFDPSETITPLGKVYAANKPNTTIGPGQNTDFVSVPSPGELVPNGDFEAGSLAPWGGYNNGNVFDLGQGGEPTHSGNFAGTVKGGAGTLSADVPVVVGKTYILKYWTKWNAPVTTSFSPTLRNALITGAPGLLTTLNILPSTDVWTQNVVEYTIPAGVTVLRIQFFKASGITFYLDDVSLKLKP